MAAQAFFNENCYATRHITNKKFECYETDGIRILCGDFFDLVKEDLAEVGAVYDRASLVALPPEMREHYARHLASILPPAHKSCSLLSTIPKRKCQGRRSRFL